MMQVLYPTYTLKIEVKDIPPSQLGRTVAGGLVGMPPVPAAIYQGQIGGGPSGHKWFNPIANKTGCDDVLAAVRDALARAGLTATITFDKFEHRS